MSIDKLYNPSLYVLMSDNSENTFHRLGGRPIDVENFSMGVCGQNWGEICFIDSWRDIVQINSLPGDLLFGGNYLEEFETLLYS